MNKADNGKIRELVKKIIAPTAERELKRDLWPRMLDRLAEPRVRVPWFDWALAGAVAMWFLFSPGALSLVLYHL